MLPTVSELPTKIKLLISFPSFGVPLHLFRLFVYYFYIWVIVTTSSVEMIPEPYRGYPGSPTPPGWHINTCHCQNVCSVSQPSPKIMEEIPGFRQLL